MFRSDSDGASRADIKARQRAYLASLDAQVGHKDRAAASERALDGRFVRNLPATPDEAALLAPLPPVANRASPRRAGRGLKSLMQQPVARDRMENGRRAQGKSYESGVGAALGGAGYGSNPEEDQYDQYDQYDQTNNEMPFARPPSPGLRKNFSRQPQPGPPVPVNLDYANNSALLQAAVSSQLNKFSASQHRTEATVKWLAEQLVQSKTDAAKHTKLLLDQHSRDAAALAALRDRLRTVEAEALEARSWRSRFERSKSGEVDSAASVALSELRAREGDYKRRQEADGDRARRAADAISDLAVRLESVRTSQSAVSDAVQSRLTAVENGAAVQAGKVANLQVRESDAAAARGATSESDGKNIEDLQNALKTVQNRLSSEELARKNLASTLADSQASARRDLARETEVLRDQMVTGAGGGRDGGGGEEERAAFVARMVEVREEANLGAVGERMDRLERAHERDREDRGRREEEREKEAGRFFADLKATAGTETAALKSRHAAMSSKTMESLRELSSEVVSIQETTRKAEKRIGELTASSLRGISGAMEAGVRQFQASTKELREVLSAEISARRSSTEKMGGRINEMEMREEARVNDLAEQTGEQLNGMQKQVDALPGMLAACEKGCKDFASSSCEKLGTDLNTSMGSLQVRTETLTAHVEDVREESKKAREHLESSLVGMNRHLSEVDRRGKDVEFKLANEVMDREKAVFKVGADFAERLAAEETERSGGDSDLAEKTAALHRNLENKILSEANNAAKKGKQDLHDSETAAAGKRGALREELLGAARNMDAAEREDLLRRIGEVKTECEGYSDAVSGEKFARTQEHVEAVREQLARSTDGVRAALEVERGARIEEALRAGEKAAEEEGNAARRIDDVRKFVTSEVDNREKERNRVAGLIADECGKVEVRVGERVTSEAQSIRSLIKATVAAEASERMADVHESRAHAEARLGSERGILKDQAARDREFCLAKAAEWNDEEKNGRMAMDTAIMNEVAVRAAAAKAEAESRDVLLAARDRIADADGAARHQGLEDDIRKLRKYAKDVVLELEAFKVDSDGKDEALGVRVDREIEGREGAAEALDGKFTEICKAEREEREEGVKALGEKFGEVARHEIGVREAMDLKLDGKFSEMADKEKTGRVGEVLRLDGRLDELWDQKDKLEDYVGAVEQATAKAITSEAKMRLEEDVEIREEKLCRVGAENSLRYVVDKVVGAMGQKGRLEEMERNEAEFALVKKNLKERVDYAMTEAEVNLRAAKETARVMAEAEHREMVQLVADETGAVRGDVHNMLGDIETAVKGAEGSVVTLDEKTTGEIEGLKKKVEEDLKGVKDDVKKGMKENLEQASSKVENEIKIVKEDLAKQEKKAEGIDWDKLRQKAEAPAPKPAAPAVAPPAPAPSAGETRGE